MPGAMYAKVAGTWAQVFPALPAYNDATGGETSIYMQDGKWFRVHRFDSGGTLEVVKGDRPFRVLLVGSGSGSWDRQNGTWIGGCPGVVSDTTQSLTVEAHAVTVGGAVGDNAQGQPSSLGTLTAAGGTIVGSPPDLSHGPNGPVTDNTITGAVVRYGERPNPGGPAVAAGQPSIAGVVIVAYEIKAPAYNDASGGTVSTVYNYGGSGKTYRVHRFDSGGTFEVKANTKPFRVLVVGGGDGGPYFVGQESNGGGVVSSDTTTLPIGSYPVTVGAGGAGGQGSVNPGSPSTFHTFTAAGGAGGAATTSDITGTASPYGGPYSAGATYGRGGLGAANTGIAGTGGVVLVAYEVETPAYNDATGGTITEVVDYNGTGQTWRIHQFDASGDFVINVAPQPFSVLVCGAGSPGGTGTIRNGGGGAGGGGAGGKYLYDAAAVLPAGALPVVVGTNGGVSTLGSLSSADGVAGGAPNSAGVKLTISGAEVGYCGGGGNGGYQGTDGNPDNGVNGAPGYDGGGAGGHSQADYIAYYGNGEPGVRGGGGGGGAGANSIHGDGDSRAGGGSTGTVIVAYQIASA